MEETARQKSPGRLCGLTQHTRQRHPRERFMGLTISCDSRSKVALRKELETLKIQLAEARLAAQAPRAGGVTVDAIVASLSHASPSSASPSRDLPSPPPEPSDRPYSKAAIMKERRASLGQLPFVGRAEEISGGVLPLAAAFDKFDADGSGGIDVEELRKALEYLGVSSDSTQAAAILKQYDAYPDNSIDVKEFATIVCALPRRPGPACTHTPPAPALMPHPHASIRCATSSSSSSSTRTRTACSMRRSCCPRSNP